MSDVSAVDNLTSNSSGSASLTGIKAAIDNLNAGKAEVSGQVFTGPISATNFSGSSSGANTGDQTLPTDATLSTSDVTTNNVSTSKHGFAPKLPNDATKYLDGSGAYSTPASLPTGMVMMYGGSSAPTGYLLCDASAVSRSTYSALFAIIGTAYGTGDGSTTFNVPDMRGRVPAGAGTGAGGGASGTGLPTGGSALTAVSRGTWKGEETHQLTVGELASHTHNINGNASTGVGVAQGTTGGGTIATASAGSDTPHNNIQPVMGINFIIKT